MKKRIFAAAAVLCLLCAALYLAHAQNTSSGQIKHFTAFFAVEGENIDPNNDMKREIARRTGADCEEMWLVGQTKESALNSYIVSGDYPDFISGDTSLYEVGALLPLDEYWDDYPNIKNYLTEEQWERFKRPDGHIYWIPQFGVTHGEDVEVTHSGEAFWIQTRVLKWAGYPEIHTVDEYFDLIERYVAANPTMEDGTPNIPFAILCDGWRYFCLENIPQFLDGYPNDGSCIVDPDTLQVIDYNTTDTAKWYFGKLNEEYHKGILSAESFTGTYEDYLKKISTGAVLGMPDQWWQFYYSVQTAYDEKGLREQGCDYVPLPITRAEGIKNQWHVTRSAELDSSTGLSITVSCEDIDGALQFVSDLLEPEIIKLRFWGMEGDDYYVDENGMFYLTKEQSGRWSAAEEKRKHFCFYSYFPRVEGKLPDGINAFSLEYQSTEFYKNQPADIQECFSAYGVNNYVDMLGNNEAPGPWFPMYSYTTALSSNSQAGQVRDRMEEIKHKWLPQVIMADDFDAAWEAYMEEYNTCDPQIYYQMLQQEVDRRVNG